MKPARHVPRFRCDFCTKVMERHAMERHERRCYKNPARVCDACQNTGRVEQDMDVYDGQDRVTLDCPYCAKMRLIEANI